MQPTEIICESNPSPERRPTRAWTWLSGLCVICATGFVVGCAPDEETTSYENPITPELLDDTAPEPTDYDPALSYEGRGGWTDNHSTDRYRFDVAAYYDAAEQQEAETLYPSHAALLGALGGRSVPSVQTIGTYLKQLDDTIYAGVEQAVQQGLEPSYEPKHGVLESALAYLLAHRSAAADDASVMVAAALELGGATPTIPAELAGRVEQLEAEFLATPSLSKPFGFYTWSSSLQQIWQQDRLLQQPLPTAESSCALAEAIASDASVRGRYEQLVALYSRMTNPLHSSLVALLDVASTSACTALGPQSFLSSSRTPEVALFEELYPEGVPDGADLMGDLIDAIRAGEIDLAPRPEDGWYQHQLYALETLLVTDRSEERAKVAFMARYKKRMQEAFATMLTQHRETHAKQADMAGDMAAAPPPTPDFRLEPLATVYVRHARSYVFLEAALDAVLGVEFLDDAAAVGEQGPEEQSLRERIRAARDLFFGLYVLSCQDIGLPWTLDSLGDPLPDALGDLAHGADQWLLSLESDPRASSDVRVLVPIASLGNGRAKYWAVAGVRATIAGYSYINGMDVSAPPPDQQSRVWLPTEQFLEVESSDTPLSRDEFRALCDQAGDLPSIQAALEAR